MLLGTIPKLLMHSSSMLVYQVELPMVAQDEYQAYIFHSWPVPRNDTRTAIGVDVVKDIAFHSMSGRLFHSKVCQGYRPTVCRPGPMYIGNTFACERGLITGHGSDRAHCVLKLQNMNRTTNFYPLGRGEYVVQTLGETYSFSCEGQRPAKEDLQCGVFYVSVPERCEFAGAGWILKGEILQYSNISLRKTVFDIELFDFNALFERVNVSVFRPDDVLGTLPPLKPIDDISFVNDGSIHEWDHPYDVLTHNMSWSNVALIIMIVIVLVCMLRYAWVHRSELRICANKLVAKAHLAEQVGPDQPTSASDPVELSHLVQQPTEPVGSMG